MHPAANPGAKTVVAARTMGCVIIFWTLVDDMLLDDQFVRAAVR